MLPGNQYLEAPQPWIPTFGYLLRVQLNRLSELEEALSDRSTCSQGIPKIPVALRRKWMLCFICTNGKLITHVARSAVFYEAESGRDKLDIWNLLPLPSPVSISALKKHLSGKQVWRARAALSDGGSISEKAFVQVMDALRRVDSAAHETASGLIDEEEHIPASEDDLPARINWAYQRDAAVTALEIAGIPRNALQLSPQLNATESKVTSIFDDTGDMRSVEDALVFRDLEEGNPDWQFVKSHRYPARTFTYGQVNLTILLANKLALEEQLGVDLIYVNESLKGVVFVQYKMFEGEDGEKGYRPDKQLDVEIARMDKAATELEKISDDISCDGYRFGQDIFFLKFCTRLLSHSNEGHVPGYYIPLGYWKRLSKDPRIIGKRGGRVVHQETLGRYFTSTGFTDLVARGWIGTSALQAEVLIPFIKGLIEGKKGIVLAVESLLPADEADDKTLPTHAPPKTRYPGKAPKIIQI